jgi:hypothetical protein
MSKLQDAVNAGFKDTGNTGASPSAQPANYPGGSVPAQVFPGPPANKPAGVSGGVAVVGKPNSPDRPAKQ